MALRAKYEADFADFYSAVAQAVTGLTGWETKGADVEKKMNDVANSLQGAPVGPAIDDMGASMDEFGVKTVDTGAIVDNEASAMSSTFASIGKTIAAAFTVQKIMEFTGEMVALGESIATVAAQTGLTNTEVQKLMQIAANTNVPIDALTKGIQTLQERLGDDNAGAVAAMKKLGINLEDFAAASEYDKLLLVADGLRKIGDDSEFAATSADLFGGTWRRIAPAIKSDLQGIGDDTLTMSDETVTNLNRAANAATSFWNAINVGGGTLVGSMFDFFSSDPLWDKIEVNFDKAAKKAGDVGGAWDSMSRAGKAGYQSAGELNQIIAESDRHFATLHTTLRDTTGAVELIEPRLGNLAQFTRTQARETETLSGVMATAAQATEVWNSGLTFTSEVIGELPAELHEVATAIDAVTQAQAAQASQGAQMGTSSAPIPINIGQTAFTGPGGIEEALKQYTRRYGTGSAAGLMGGGSHLPDFITWARSQGLATGGLNTPNFPAGGAVAGAGLNQTINMNGLLGTNDPQTQELIKNMVGDALVKTMAGQRLLSSA